MLALVGRQNDYSHLCHSRQQSVARRCQSHQRRPRVSSQRLPCTGRAGNTSARVVEKVRHL